MSRFIFCLIFRRSSASSRLSCSICFSSSRVSMSSSSSSLLDSAMFCEGTGCCGRPGDCAAGDFEGTCCCCASVSSGGAVASSPLCTEGERLGAVDSQIFVVATGPAGAFDVLREGADGELFFFARLLVDLGILVLVSPTLELLDGCGRRGAPRLARSASFKVFEIEGDVSTCAEDDSRLA